MQAKWGTSAMPVNGAEVTSQMSVVEATDWGMPLRYQMAYTVRVWFDGVGQLALTKSENDFRAALLKRDQDFVLFTDSGAQSSCKLLVKDTASGTRVTSISTPEAQGGEFVTRRTIAFTVVAEYDVTDSKNAVVSWQETVTVIGNGGPRRSWRFPVNAPAVRQIVAPYSLVRATQSGQAVGYKVRPRKPLPLFPDYVVNEAESLTVVTPRYMGVGREPVDWPVSWSYTFERGDGPLVGLPRLPPGVI